VYDNAPSVDSDIADDPIFDVGDSTSDTLVTIWLCLRAKQINLEMLMPFWSFQEETWERSAQHWKGVEHPAAKLFQKKMNNQILPLHQAISNANRLKRTGNT
jgi:hypothetical protein